MRGIIAALITLSFITSANAGSTSLARIVAPLKAKAEEIVRDCHSRVISTDQRGGVTPNHRQHRAVDIQGNPGCIYKKLAGWPGGYSTDYASAPCTPHVHISYNPAHEWGRRFKHGFGCGNARVAKKKAGTTSAAVKQTLDRNGT